MFQEHEAPKFLDNRHMKPYAPAAFTPRKYSWYSFLLGTAEAQWLRCCATNRKVAGSIPADVSGFFIDIKLSDRTMALGSTGPLTEMSTGSISWGLRRPVCKADNLPPSCAVVMKYGYLNFLETSGSLRPCNGTDLPFPVTHFC